MARRENRFQQGEKDDINSKLIAINRVTKVVKGGKTMRFSALIVAGDGQGRLGLGMGKAAEVSEAIKKATAIAKRNMITVSTVGTTIPHEVIGVFGKGKVIMLPA
ncbi:MAG TPA: 30S ribosomal protein S5, partial [Candidatus Ornithoclostridium faecigallinarum]|nr:30S ribosomal protein S5 [Candidatus Ornithoclostridium faecigallinarum]